MRAWIPWVLLAVTVGAAAFAVSCGDDDDDNDDASSTDDDSDDDADDDAGGEGEWADSVSGLTWQNGEGVGAELYTWEEAIAYCDGLEWAGASDWRLPTIDEQRTLIADCEATQTGGACGVTGECLEIGCWDDDTCGGCVMWDGPGEMGMHWPPEVTGTCCWYWSASVVTDEAERAWGVGFGDGVVNVGDVTIGSSARCVR